MFSAVLFLGLSSASAVAQSPQDHHPSATFSVDRKTQIPGETLKPGEYTIHLTNRLFDRLIITIDGTGKKEHTVFLAIPSSALAASASGPLTWDSNPAGKPALRGFAFPSGPVVEFVYPKAEAAALVQKNSASVVAIDPESEGLHELSGLTTQDLQVINLWTLSLTHLGPKQKTPGIMAEKYKPAPSTSSAPAETLAAAAPPQPSTPAAEPLVARAEPPASLPVPSTVRPASRRPALTALPHTASTLPWAWLTGLFSLLGAVLLHLVPRTRTSLGGR